MLINDLLQLGQGSVIELDKIAGEPMEILINDKLVAMGEVVVVNEKFGVRLTDVVSQFGLSDLTVGIRIEHEIHITHTIINKRYSIFGRFKRY